MRYLVSLVPWTDFNITKTLQRFLRAKLDFGWTAVLFNQGKQRASLPEST